LLPLLKKFLKVFLDFILLTIKKTYICSKFGFSKKRALKRLFENVKAF